jgi:hypothetical protein
MLRSLAALLLTLMLAGCDNSGCTSDCMQVNGDGPTIKGSGTLKTETRTVEPFTTIRFSRIGGNLEIERTGTAGLTVTAEDNVLPLLTSEVKDGTLTLSIAKGKGFSGKQPTYKITVGDLREVDVAGSGRLDATKLQGAALTVSMSGSGTGKLAGQVDDLRLTVTGSGSCNAGDLQAKRAKATVTGSGDLTVNASDELDAEVSGSGSIRYVGSPKLKSDVSGSGSIKQKP